MIEIIYDIMEEAAGESEPTDIEEVAAAQE